MLSGVNNSMFVARRVVPVNGNTSSSSSYSGNYDLDMDARLSASSLEELAATASIGTIYNQDQLPPSQMGYTTKDILGFVDVTEKNFGLASDSEGNDLIGFSDTQTLASGKKTPVRRKDGARRTLRPVLTNLSVKPETRGSGVGSALVDACEDIVMSSEWTRTYSEMVLEVEEENEGAQRFYERRGYVALFADPTSRRFDTSGLFLSNVRTTKICYRKDLTKKRAERGSGANGDGNGGLDMFFAKIRQAIGMD